MLAKLLLPQVESQQSRNLDLNSDGLSETLQNTINQTNIINHTSFDYPEAHNSIRTNQYQYQFERNININSNAINPTQVFRQHHHNSPYHNQTVIVGENFSTSNSHQQRYTVLHKIHTHNTTRKNKFQHSLISISHNLSKIFNSTTRLT